MSVLSRLQSSAEPARRWQNAALSGWRGWLAGGLGLLFWVLALTSLVYQFRPQWQLTLGDYYDPPYLHGDFSQPETIANSTRSFRWTTGTATVSVPNVGRGAWLTTLALLTAHPDSSPVAATVTLPDGRQLRLADSAEPRAIHLLIPPQSMRQGNLTLTFDSQRYQEPTASARMLGVAVFGLAAQPVGARPWFPPPAALGLLLLIVTGAALTLRATGVPGWIALATAAALGAGLIAPLMTVRAPFAMWLPGLAMISGLSLLLVLGLRRLLPWIFASASLKLEPAALRLLLLLFVGGFWLKAGGMLYPYMIAIDIHWHMDRVRWILDGRLAEMYRPGAFNESVMPVKEFGANPPTIPYSPFFHIFATTFAMFPWKLETTAKIFSAIIDNSRILIIYFLARQFGLPKRAGLLASAFYAVLPATFLLHSWGNVPTTFGMWWTLITSTLIISAWGRFRERTMFIWLTGLLLLTFLMYTVMAVFLGLTLVIWLAIVAVRHRDQRPQVWALAGAITLAFAISLVVYYGQYVPDIVAKTIPYFSQTMTQGPEAVGAVQYQATHAANFRAYGLRLWNYGLLPAFLLAPLALWLVSRQDQSQPGRPDTSDQAGASRLWLGRTWICAMFFVSLLFIPIDRTVPMVDKHVFYLLPPLAILIGFMLDQALGREPAGWRWLAAVLAAVVIAMMMHGVAPIFYLLPLVAMAAGWAFQRLSRRWTWAVVPVALGYGVLLVAALELWVRRIVSVTQVW